MLLKGHDPGMTSLFTLRWRSERFAQRRNGELCVIHCVRVTQLDGLLVRGSCASRANMSSRIPRARTSPEVLTRR